MKKALDTLGYNEEAIERIISHVEETGSIEGADDLAPEHLTVFDCAFKPVDGDRFIAPVGHLKIMAAVQPFISGAISKTVNLPNDATVKDVEEIFMSAWKLGLKAITIYRDGCKLVQPLGQQTDISEVAGAPVRRRLPIDTRSVRHKFEIGGQKGYIHTGFYEDGSVGEIFIRMNKEGSTISGLMDTVATLTSIALQYGVPLEALVNKFSHVRFEPSGFTSNKEIPIAKSLTDYIFRYLGISFLSETQQRAAGLLAPNDHGDQTLIPTGPITDPNRPPATTDFTFNPQSDAPACPDCGAIMIRSGACYECLNCGATTGCS
jgi:ribonucleoside-diphosphate reductase alpha chain